MNIIKRVLHDLGLWTETRDINVTKDLIEKGHPADAWMCPVALALRATFPDAVEVRAGASSAQIIFSDRVERWLYPATLADWVRAFDRDMPVTGRSFQISLVETRSLSEREREIWRTMSI